jgi:RHS repeat-associated protein
MGYSYLHEQAESLFEPLPRSLYLWLDFQISIGAPFYGIILSTKYLDGDTKLYYYGYRYLSPGMGRWLSRDPIEEAGSLNIFSLCGNDNVNHIDFLGEDWDRRNSMGMKTLHFEPLECGAYIWRVKLTISPGNFIRSGSIAQHMQIIEDFKDQYGTPHQDDHGGGFWEDFYVPPFSDYGTPIDEWIPHARKNTEGKKTEIGSATYHPRRPPVRKNPYDENPPNPSDSTYPTIVRTVVVEWDCLPCSTDRTTKLLSMDVRLQ